ncbi:hypothetical protein P153DRAFT_370203 [Dothidotthia symphoricarpi CBS 119687]|uniref:NAP family protein n=1 Tax=Dothidotthia symphoricarpi CBS 119687 TaxID=1392245 RepID=A0A6A6A4N0_9PLEO|nr:uncharacterized protein P153DRAFT_370203 [Dothidotthia symphoricarpi CBS 119687]KAF2125551.1 hypothetical protein P153DRAFT_370203 [Dothidotthia symphoricarpi CBS 119687]
MEELQVRFEELSVLESDFEDAELELLRKSEALHTPLYKKRAQVISRIPHFWSLVFEQAPTEIDNFIQPSDSRVFAECLDTFEVTRFDLENSPRSFALKFGFSENEWFSDTTLEKKFWFRKTKEWAGLVSEPVKIHWKKGKDLTGGLTDAACKLGEARQKLGNTSTPEARKKEAALPEYKNMAQRNETATEASVSFFGLFAFVSGYRWVSAEESAQVEKEDKEKMEKLKRGEAVDDDDDDDDDDEAEPEQQDYQETEVFPDGDEVVTLIAEDMWPNAIKYYKAAFDEDADGFSGDEDEDLSEIEMDDSGSEGETVDIRALVGKGRTASDAPPAKKQRKA